MKHTPGPWYYQENSDTYTHIVRGPDAYFVHQGPQHTEGIAEANARLIAAAPELLEACNDALNTLIGCCVAGPGRDDRAHMLATQSLLRIAIRKAEGTPANAPAAPNAQQEAPSEG